MRAIAVGIVVGGTIAAGLAQAQPAAAGGLFAEEGYRPVHRFYRPFQDTRRFAFPTAHYQWPQLHRYHYRRRPVGFVWGRGHAPPPVVESHETLK
jgi:hypothetical protein